MDEPSLDNQSFATGVVTSPISTSFMEKKTSKSITQQPSESYTEPTMDKTQSEDDDTPRFPDSAPLKISYEKPRLCSVHFKTISHIIATCLLLPLTFELFAMCHVDFSVFRAPILLNALAMTSSACHVAFLAIGGPPRMATAVANFWITVLMSIFSFAAGIFIWWILEPRLLNSIQFIVPQHILLVFGSICSLIFAGIAVYVEAKAKQYAIAY